MTPDETINSLDLTHCVKCGGSYGGICGQHTGCVACQCVQITINPQPTLGWVCPNCNAGMSPLASRCPCMDPPFQITCEPSWTTCVSS